MNLLALLKKPLVWAAGLVLVLLIILCYVRYSADADGNSQILSTKAEKQIRQDLAEQAARRTRDSRQAARADSAATASYRQGQQAGAAALRLHQRTHEKIHFTDTSARELQEQLSKY